MSDESPFEFEVDSNLVSAVIGTLFGVGVLVAAFAFAFSDLDPDGDGKLRLPLFLIPVYMAIGRWGCALLLGIPGVLSLLGSMLFLVDRFRKPKS